MCPFNAIKRDYNMIGDAWAKRNLNLKRKLALKQGTTSCNRNDLIKARTDG